MICNDSLLLGSYKMCVRLAGGPFMAIQMSLVSSLEQVTQYLQAGVCGCDSNFAQVDVLYNSSVKSAFITYISLACATC